MNFVQFDYKNVAITSVFLFLFMCINDSIKNSKNNKYEQL